MATPLQPPLIAGSNIQPPQAPDVPASYQDVLDAKRYAKKIKHLQSSTAGGWNLVTHQQAADVFVYKHKVREQFGRCCHHQKNWSITLNNVMETIFSVVVSNAAPAAAPAWFSPAFDTAVLPLSQVLNSLGHQLNSLDRKIDHLAFDMRL